jgi:hypothetical protein
MPRRGLAYVLVPMIVGPLLAEACCERAPIVPVIAVALLPD